MGTGVWSDGLESNAGDSVAGFWRGRGDAGT